MDSLYEKKLLSEEDMDWWRDFFQQQENTDWANLGGKAIVHNPNTVAGIR